MKFTGRIAAMERRIRVEPQRFHQAIVCLLIAVATPFSLAVRGAGIPVLSIPTNNVFIVTNAAYGAKGDGVTDDTAAIQSAIHDAHVANGGVVRVPSSSNAYMCGPLTMENNINLQIDAGATLRLLPYAATGGTPAYPGSDAAGRNPFVTIDTKHDVLISGGGTIDGQGAAWWAAFDGGIITTRPKCFISPSSSDKVIIQDLTLNNPPEHHISFGNPSNVAILRVNIDTPTPSHNTDGIDVSGSHILISDCSIRDGDDNIAIGGSSSFQNDITITNCTFGWGHGLSIGSYTAGGVSNLLVVNCTWNGTDNGIRLKSDVTRGGFVDNLVYSNLTMVNVGSPIALDSYYLTAGAPGRTSGNNPLYPPNSAANWNQTPPTSLVTPTKVPIWRNIKISNLISTGATQFSIIWGLPLTNAYNFTLDNVKISGPYGLLLYNIYNVQCLNGTTITPTYGNALQTYNSLIITSQPTNTTANAGSSAALSVTTAGVSGINNKSPTCQWFKNGVAVPDATNFTLQFTNVQPGDAGNYSVAISNRLDKYDTTGSLGLMADSAPVFANSQIATLSVNSVITNVPPAPANLMATAGNQSVSLTWSASATATNYHVKRSTTSGGSYTTTNSASATSYSDTQVTNGTTYYYVVSAVNAVGEGTNSAEVSATPQAPQTNTVSANVFSDNFSTSTLNAGSPVVPTPTSTSYELISTKPWSPTPTISSGHLKYGIAATGSGYIETQALFTNSPVTLANVGDTLSLTVTFANTSGLLTQASAMGFGLYNSGRNFPVPGGLNGTAVVGSTGNATGNAQTWAGYVGQLAFTGSSSQILTRSPQTGTANNNQDALTTGSGSSYLNPAGTTVGTASPASSVTLVAGNPYTEVLTITLTATNTLAITNFLYSGTSTNGAVLSQFGAVAAGATYLTNKFDALAIGWRAMVNTYATAIDINQITVNATLTTSGPPVSLIPTNIVCQVVGGQMQLSWPADHLGWRLQIQTNDLSSGLGTNWTTVPNSTNINSMNIVINPTNGAVFLRLIYP